MPKKPVFLDKLKEKKVVFIILAICFLYIFLKSMIYLKGLVFFDEGVYVGMAKYFASAGKIGYFESIRPLALPLLIMPLQLIPINPLITGSLIGLLLTLCCIPAVYYSTNKCFGNKTALWSAFLFSVSVSIIMFGSYILPDVPAYVLALLGAALVIERKYILGGITVGIGFLFKFPVFIVIFPLLAYILIKEKKPLPLIRFGLGVAISSLPYFIFNMFYYQGSILSRLFKPLIDASRLIENPTWVYTKASLWIYLAQIIITETIAVLLLVFALVKNIKKHKENMMVILACMALFLAYFSFRVPRYDMRYVLPVVIFIMPIAGLGASEFFKSKRKYFAFFVMLFIFPGIVSICLFGILKEPVKHDLFMKQIIEEYNGTVFVTNNGIPLLYSKSKVELMPGSNLGNTYLTYRENDNADWFIFHPDGYPCPPGDDICELNFKKKTDIILSRNNILNCGYLNGARLIILTKDKPYISKEECTKKINYYNITSSESSVFIRISSAGFTLEGDVQNKDALLEIINIAEDKKIPLILVLTSSSIKPNNDAIDFIRSIPEEIELGVLPIENIETNVFINNIYKWTGRKITAIAPLGDDWNKKEVSIPYGINCSIVGSWDQTILPVNKKGIDLFVVSDWQRNEVYDYETLKSWYDILYDCEDEIGIDIPLYLMSKDNFIKVKRFIDYIGIKQEIGLSDG